MSARTRRAIGTLVALAAIVIALLLEWGVAQPDEAASQEPVDEQQAAAAAEVAELLREIPTRPERNADTYDRDEWRHWVSVSNSAEWQPWVKDRSGCDTREAVLIRDGWKASTGESCRITGGTWRTEYDQRRHPSPDTIDIDHRVPLSEAHQSGGAKWSAQKKEQFANDPMNVVAATDSLNRAKGDKDLAEWLPEHNQCSYVITWVLIKDSYGLSMDRAEKQAAQRVLSDPRCQKGNPVR